MPELDEPQLETALSRAGAVMPYPATPSLERPVLAAITTDSAEQRAGTGWLVPAGGMWRTAALAFVVAVALAVGGVIIHPESRSALGEFFGIVEGQRVNVGEPAMGSPATPPSVADPGLPDFALPVSPADAPEWLEFAPGMPEGFREPEAMYVVEWGEQPLLIAQYPALDLWQTRGGGFFGKSPPPDSLIDPLTVNGQPAWWIDSDGHETAFYDADGHEVAGSRRSVESHLLIWNGTDGRTYRMETELPFAEALAIAETLP